MKEISKKIILDKYHVFTFENSQKKYFCLNHDLHP